MVSVPVFAGAFLRLNREVSYNTPSSSSIEQVVYKGIRFPQWCRIRSFHFPQISYKVVGHLHALIHGTAVNFLISAIAGHTCTQVGTVFVIIALRGLSLIGMAAEPHAQDIQLVFLGCAILFCIGFRKGLVPGQAVPFKIMGNRFSISGICPLIFCR